MWVLVCTVGLLSVSASAHAHVHGRVWQSLDYVCVCTCMGLQQLVAECMLLP